MVRITMLDVAKEAGVSKSTVSQFLNERYEYMGEGTRKRIKEAIERLGYRPNYVARSLKQKRTAMIGIIVANIMHRFSTEVSRAIEDFCNENEMHTIFCNADENPEKEEKYIEMLLAKQVDGLIIFPTGQNLPLYKKLIKEEYPVVFMDRKIMGLKVPTVVVNNEDATKLAVNHLFEQGHKKIAMITPPLTISSRIERIKGYKQSFEEHGIKVMPEYMKSVKVTLIKQELEVMFSVMEPPTALLAGNDLVLMEVMEFFKDKHIKIIEDVSLVVFDNIPFAHIANPSITTIGQPAFLMGEKAAELLLKQINNETIETMEYVFSCELNIRESSLR